MNPTGTTIPCGTCQAPLPAAYFNATEMQPCMKCRTASLIKVFPAYYRVNKAPDAGAPSLEGDAECFFHDNKAAAEACESCGRFLCQLCAIDMGGQHLCAACLASIRNAKGLNNFKSRYPRYDRIAFGLANYGLLFSLPLFFMPTLVTAPAAIYLVVKHWREPISIVPSARWKMITAFLFAGLQLMAWVVGLFLLLVKVFTAW